MPDERIGLQLDLGDSIPKAKELSTALETVKHTTADVGNAAGQAAGSKSAGGGGLLSVSYAMQDFVAVYGTGGFARALGAISNNMAGIAMATGLGSGAAGALTVLVTAASAGIPILQKWFGVLEEGKDKAKAAAEEVAKFQKQVEATHQAFGRLASAPSAAEGESARAIVDYLSKRPNADRARAAIAAGVGPEQALSMLSPAEQQQLQRAGKELAERQQRIQGILGGQKAAGATPEWMDETRRYLERRYDIARRQALVDSFLQQGRERFAEQTVTGATAAGPAGAAAREELLRRAGGALPGLAELTPEAMERQARFRKQQEVNAEAQRRIKAANDARQRQWDAEHAGQARAGQAQHQADAAWAQKDRQNIQREIQRQHAVDQKNREAERRYQQMHGAENEAQREFIQAVTGQLSAQQQRINMWRQATQNVRRLQNNATAGIP